MIGFGFTISLNDDFSGSAQKVKGAMGGMESFAGRSAKNITSTMKSIGQSIAGAAETAAKGVAAAGALAVGSAMMAASEITNQQAEIGTLFGVTGQELEKLTSMAGAAGSVFGKDFSEIAKGAKGLEMAYKDLGLSGEGAFTLLQAGLLATNGKLDVDNVYEYSTQLKQAGLSASEGMALMVQGIQSGAYMDKLPDVIKETGLRLREMPKATKDAIVGLEKMSGGFNIEGQILSSTQLMQGLNNGTISTFKATQSLVGSMKSADNVTRQTAIADVFGAIGEDLGQVLFQLDTMNLDLNSLMQKNPQLARQFQKLKLNEDINTSLQKVAPTLNGLTGSFENMFGSIKLGFLNAMDNEGVKRIFEAATSGIDFISAKIVAFTSSGEFQKIGNLIGFAFDKFNEYKPIIEGAFSSLQTFGTEIMNTFKPIGTYLSTQFERVSGAISKAFNFAGLDSLSEKGQGVMDLFLVPFRIGIDAINFAFQISKPIIDLVVGAFDGLMSTMDWIIPSFNYAKEAFSGLLAQFDTGGTSFDWLAVTGQVLGKVIGGTLTAAFYIVGGAIEVVSTIIGGVITTVNFLIDGLKTVFAFADKITGGSLSKGIAAIGESLGLGFPDSKQTVETIGKQAVGERNPDAQKQTFAGPTMSQRDSSILQAGMLNLGSAGLSANVQGIAEQMPMNPTTSVYGGEKVTTVNSHTEKIQNIQKNSVEQKQRQINPLQPAPQQPQAVNVTVKASDVYLDGEKISRNTEERREIEGNRR